MQCNLQKKCCLPFAKPMGHRMLGRQPGACSGHFCQCVTVDGHCGAPVWTHFSHLQTKSRADPKHTLGLPRHTRQIHVSKYSVCHTSLDRNLWATGKGLPLLPVCKAGGAGTPWRSTVKVPAGPSEPFPPASLSWLTLLTARVFVWTIILWSQLCFVTLKSFLIYNFLLQKLCNMR